MTTGITILLASIVTIVLAFADARVDSRSQRILVVYVPGTSADAAFADASQRGGRVIAQPQPWLMLVTADEPAQFKKLHDGAALFLLDAAAVPGCGEAKKTNKTIGTF